MKAKGKTDLIIWLPFYSSTFRMSRIIIWHVAAISWSNKPQTCNLVWVLAARHWQLHMHGAKENVHADAGNQKSSWITCRWRGLEHRVRAKKWDCSLWCFDNMSYKCTHHPVTDRSCSSSLLESKPCSHLPIIESFGPPKSVAEEIWT